MNPAYIGLKHDSNPVHARSAANCDLVPRDMPAAPYAISVVNAHMPSFKGHEGETIVN